MFGLLMWVDSTRSEVTWKYQKFIEEELIQVHYLQEICMRVYTALTVYLTHTHTVETFSVCLCLYFISDAIVHDRRRTSETWSKWYHLYVTVCLKKSLFSTIIPFGWLDITDIEKKNTSNIPYVDIYLDISDSASVYHVLLFHGLRLRPRPLRSLLTPAGVVSPYCLSTPSS